MIDIGDSERQRRLTAWGQTPEQRISGPDEAQTMIDRLGLLTHYPTSSELPNFFHAFTGDPDVQVDPGHDSPSGKVYAWRWELGGRAAGFYATVVRNRPSWVSWPLLPAVLRLCGEVRSAEELYDAGEISGNALRLAEVLETAGDAVATGDLRRDAGFPTGKEQRTAYLKALDELDRRLLVAKVFSPGSTDMSHALVRIRYPEALASAERLTRADALTQLLQSYLPAAAYILPTTLAKHLGLPESELRDALSHFVAEGTLVPTSYEGQRGMCYVWQGESI